MACQCQKIASLRSDAQRCANAMTKLNNALNYARNIETECTTLANYSNVTFMTSNDAELGPAMEKKARPMLAIVNEAIGKVAKVEGELTSEIAKLVAEDENWDHENGKAY